MMKPLPDETYWADKRMRECRDALIEKQAQDVRTRHGDYADVIPEIGVKELMRESDRAPFVTNLASCRHDPLGQNPNRICECTREKATVLEANKYTALENVLHRALEQASKGKGAERHATNQPFENQPMLVASRLIGSHHGLLYQAIKKTQESARLPTTERQVAELLGAIVYLSGAIIFIEDPK